MTKNHWYGISAGIAVLSIMAAILFWTWTSEDKIEEGKIYPLAMTYLAHLQMPDGKVVDGRMFDFVDRNVVKSKPVPLFDGRGLVVREISAMKLGTVKLVRQKRAGMAIEGVEYPPQEWLEWHFNYNLKSEQKFIPTIIVKK